MTARLARSRQRSGSSRRNAECCLPSRLWDSSLSLRANRLPAESLAGSGTLRRRGSFDAFTGEGRFAVLDCTPLCVQAKVQFAFAAQEMAPEVGIKTLIAPRDFRLDCVADEARPILVGREYGTDAREGPLEEPRHGHPRESFRRRHSLRIAYYPDWFNTACRRLKEMLVVTLSVSLRSVECTGISYQSRLHPAARGRGSQ